MRSGTARAVAAAAILLAAGTGPIQAQPPAEQPTGLAAAKALFDAGKYADVEAALRDEFAKETQPLEVLELSYRAAAKCGKIVTAQKRITSIIRSTGTKDLARVLEAAQVAEKAGNEPAAVQGTANDAAGSRRASLTAGQILAWRFGSSLAAALASRRKMFPRRITCGAAALDTRGPNR